MWLFLSAQTSAQCAGLKMRKGALSLSDGTKYVNIVHRIGHCGNGSDLVLELMSEKETASLSLVLQVFKAAFDKIRAAHCPRPLTQPAHPLGVILGGPPSSSSISRDRRMPENWSTLAEDTRSVFDIARVMFRFLHTDSAHSIRLPSTNARASIRVMSSPEQREASASPVSLPSMANDADNFLPKISRARSCMVP